MRDYLKELNDLEIRAEEEKADIYEEYGDHSDDAELCWSQRYEEYYREITELAEEAAENGVPVVYRGETGRWVYAG